MTLKCAKCLVALCAAGEPSGVSIADLGRGSCHIRLSIPPRRDVSCDFSEWTDRPTDPPSRSRASRAANEENEERAIERTANCSGLQGIGDLRGSLQSDSRNLPPKPESRSVSRLVGLILILRTDG